MNPTLAEIIRFLNRVKVRATYGAVAVCCVLFHGRWA